MASEERFKKGGDKMIPFYNPEAVEPPEYDEEEFYCPACGERVFEDTIVYINTLGEIIGCEFCARERYYGEL